MSQARRIVKNVGVLWVAEGLTALLSFALAFVIARFLGDSGFGEYSFALSFASLFIIFSEFGTLTFLIKEVASQRSRAAELSHNIAAMKLVFGVLTVAVSIGAAAIVQPGALWVVAIASVAMFFNYYGYLFRALFQAYEVMEYDALTKVVERVISVALGIIVLMMGYGVEVLLLTQLLSFVIFFALSLGLAHKVVPMRLRFDAHIWKEIFLGSLPYWLTSVFIYAYFRIDAILLGLMRSYAEVGWYSAAFRIVESLAFLQTVVVVAVFPALSRMAKERHEHLNLLFGKAFSYLFALGLALAVGGLVLAPRIIALIFGDQFAPAAMALRILSAALFFLFISFIMGHLLNALGSGWTYARIAGFAALFNVLANLWAIPRYGYLGAAWVTLGTHMLACALFLLILARHGFPAPYGKLWQPLVAAAAMAIALLTLASLNLFLLIPMGAMMFLGVLLLMRWVDEDEWRQLRALVRR